MLQRIRDNASGPMAYAIVGLIALVFSVWGIGSYFTESADPAVAKVGGTEITKFQLQRAYDRRYQQLRDMMGDDFDPDLIERDRFRRMVLDELIDREMLAQYAEDAGYRATDAQLLRSLREEERFREGGSFSPELYRRLLAQSGIDAGAFEEGLREDLRVQQVRSGVLDTSFVTHREVARAFAVANQQRLLAYLAFRSADYRDQVEISDAEVESYYRDNTAAFLREERVKLDYVALDRNRLAVDAQPGTEDLRALYEREKNERFTQPERRLARHILVRVDAGTDTEAARDRVQALVAELEEGADFAELARRQSDDEATAGDGGSLDWITRGAMTASFEDALFELEEGEVSTPVRTEFGWHLIKLEEVDPVEVQPFNDPEVQSQLLSLYRSQERDRRFREMSERLDALSFEAPESLQPIADELDLPVESTDWIARGADTAGGDLADNPSVIKAAFSDAVLEDGLNSTPIQLSGDRLVVLRVAEHQPAEQRPLEAVRDDIQEHLARRAAAELAREQARAALEAVREEGGDLAAVAERTEAELNRPGWVGRNQPGLDPALLDGLFSLPRPPEDRAEHDLVPLSDGGVAVVRLEGVRSPGPRNAQERQSMARNLGGWIAGLEYAALRESLRKDFKVKIHENRLN